MTQQMQNLQLSQTRKCPGGPASPSAAKRLYRNLSEKLRGSTSSFEDAYFFGKTDRLRKASRSALLEDTQLLMDGVTGEHLELFITTSVCCHHHVLPEKHLVADECYSIGNVHVVRLQVSAQLSLSVVVVSVESREAHLSSLVVEAERRAADMAAQAQRDGLSLEACHKDKQLRAWEWRSKLYKRMKTGFQHARAPEAPSMVRLSVSSSTTLTVTFQEPQCLNSTVVTKYRVEWSCLKDFSLLAGEMVLDNLQTLKCIISNLTTFMWPKVFGQSEPNSFRSSGFSPSTMNLLQGSDLVQTPGRQPGPALVLEDSSQYWRESDGREPRRRGHIEAMERLLQQVRATHTHYCCGDSSKLQNPSRKQSVSRSLKHLFNSSNKFVKTLKRGIYLAAVFYHKDSLLVTAEDQIPIVEVDDSYSSSLMQDFLWFTKSSMSWCLCFAVATSLSVMASRSACWVMRASRSRTEDRRQYRLMNFSLKVVFREEWDWIQTLSAAGEKEQTGEESEEAGPRPESHAPLLYYELQTAIKSLLKHINLPLPQARHFRLYSQEVVELGHGVSFLLLLPAADNVCSAPGQSNPYTTLSGFLHLPLQMFELVDFPQLDEVRRDLRWITDALQYARYKQPRGGVPLTCLVDADAPDNDSGQQKTDSTSSTMDYLPTPSPSPELCRRKVMSDSLLGSDEDGSSEVFLPTDSDYDSSDALSPRELDLLYSPAQDLSQQAVHSLGGSAPDVLQIHELRYSVCPPKDLPLSSGVKDPLSSPLLPHSPSLSTDFPFSPSGLPRSPSLSRTLPTSPSVPLSPRFSKDLPLSLPLSPALSDTTKTFEGLSLSKEGVAPLRALANPPAKRKLLSRSHRGQYFSGPQRWLRGHSGETHTGSLSEGVYTKQLDLDLPLPGDPPSLLGTTYVSHASCVLESRKGRHREPRPHVRRIFVEPCKELSPGHERSSWEEEEE
ncbi:ankyrin repeat and fibronectin type-III domain-containing protein 1, partial [Morone saxatilis]|uniref:ankyrin repeat and fibronectin type-III domain-containing protein 1 n=1 Tax=Morone saxatilis TaxID=34816 RepID=UPI0015E24CE7